MVPKSRVVRAILATLMASCAVAVEAAEVPYAVLHRALAAVKAAAPYERLRAVQRIESKRDGVPPQAIELVVKARAGDIRVPVAADGVLQFPLDDALALENPVVVTNQPAGSLTLLVSIELPTPPGGELPAKDLIESLEQADRLFADASAGDGRHVRGVEFRFAPGQGSVTLRGTTERLLVPDGDGRVLLMRDSDLADATAVELGAAPLQVLPFLER